MKQIIPTPRAKWEAIQCCRRLLNKTANYFDALIILSEPHRLTALKFGIWFDDYPVIRQATLRKRFKFLGLIPYHKYVKEPYAMIKTTVYHPDGSWMASTEHIRGGDEYS